MQCVHKYRHNCEDKYCIFILYAILNIYAFIANANTVLWSKCFLFLFFFCAFCSGGPDFLQTTLHPWTLGPHLSMIVRYANFWSQKFFCETQKKGISLVKIFRWQSTRDALHRIIIIVWTINLSRNIIRTIRLLHFLYQVKNFTLKNPTGSVVSVEIRTLSSYPFPLEALDTLTKWYIP